MLIVHHHTHITIPLQVKKVDLRGPKARLWNTSSLHCRAFSFVVLTVADMRRASTKFRRSLVVKTLFGRLSTEDSRKPGPNRYRPAVALVIVALGEHPPPHQKSRVRRSLWIILALNEWNFESETCAWRKCTPLRPRCRGENARNVYKISKIPVDRNGQPTVHKQVQPRWASSCRILARA